MVNFLLKSIERLLVCMLFQTIPLYLFSQLAGENGATSHALSGADLFVASPWSVNSNPATLTELSSPEFALLYSNRFAVRELSSRHAAFNYPLDQSSVGLSVGQFGFENYSESKMGIAYSKKFGDKFNLGMQLNYLSTQLIEPYGRSSSLSVNMGMRTKLTDQIELAAGIQNPTRANKTEDKGEVYPQNIKIGIQYNAIEQLTIATVLTKEPFQSPRLAIGISYLKTESLALRVGYGSHPNQFSFGFQCMIKQLKIELATAYEQQLGFSPVIGISYILMKQRKQLINN
jgi:hypothetical protein